MTLRKSHWALCASVFLACVCAWPAAGSAQEIKLDFKGLELPAVDAGASESASDAPVFTQTITPISGLTKAPEPVTLTFTLSPENAKPGETVTLTIDMEIDEGWHSFSRTMASKDQVGLPTVIKLNRSQNLAFEGLFSESPEPELYNGTDFVHHKSVTWTRKLKVTGEGNYGISGSVRYSVCEKGLCKPPKTIKLELGELAQAVVVTDPDIPAVPGTVKSGDPAQSTETDAGAAPEPQALEIAKFELVESAQPDSLAINLLFAFLGGLILNVMPCVLPVIAIKVLSFVQQAGESRSRILALNVTYACGVVAVFLALAALAVFLGKGWGELFQNSQFNLLMAAFVFAMGLSLLGVFEIPVPGMVGSAAGGAHQEGLLGAFFTGIFATLLATPCSGPFMGTTLAWSLQQPAMVVFLIWGMMGVGMASPYLLIGAFPQLVHWLPKPGMWMVRFKEFAGFVLMGAVIWLINALEPALIVPALVILVGIALGLWMVGNLYDTASPVKHKWSVRTAAAVLSAIIIGFGWNMQFQKSHVEWEEFSTQRVEQLRKEGKPILIDFTADWCAVCKTNEAVAIDREATAAYFREHGITAIKADYTDASPEIARWLELAGQEGVPLVLIFPKGQPNRAIPLRASFTQSQLLEILDKAMGGAETAGQDRPPTTLATPLDTAPAN